MEPGAWFPIYLSLKVAGVATLAALVIGIPLAWLLARRKLPLTNLWGTLVLLPLVLPPTVLGYYLLLVIGRQSALGRFLVVISLLTVVVLLVVTRIVRIADW
jgi:molybdate transport system permease protein